MNTEVNYEIAKLLYLKGYEGKSKKGFDKMGNLGSPYFGDHFTNGIANGDLIYEAPTIAEVIMWLYEKHSIWIAVDLIDNSRTFHFKYSITISNDREYHDEDCFDMAKTIYSDSKEKFGEPEVAYLVAFTHTLNNLI